MPHTPTHDSQQTLINSAAFQNTAPTAALGNAVVGASTTLQTPTLPATEVATTQATPSTILSQDTGQVDAPTSIDAVTGTSTEVSETFGEVQAPQAIEAATVDSSAVTDVAAAEGVAAQRDLESSELVSNQLAELTAGLETGEIPLWAQGAVTAVDQQLAARGISRSSIGQAELTNAILQSALPIAQSNAAALQRRSEINLSNEQQLVMQNLSNEQQSGLLTAQQQQQVLLSNQSAENAARQFNSASAQQTEQFMAQLKSSIVQNNASRLDAMSQFNTGQLNSISQFNTSAQIQADQFNANMSSAIAQSNVAWRRQANLSNTAAINTANLQDASARNALTTQDMSNRWQAARDLANWAQTSTQNELDRSNKLALGAMQAEAAVDAAFQQALGTVIGYGSQTGAGQKVIDTLVGAGTNLISGVAGSVFGGSSDVDLGRFDFDTTSLSDFDFGFGDVSSGGFDLGTAFESSDVLGEIGGLFDGFLFDF